MELKQTLSPSPDATTVTLEIGSGQTIIIDKLFGPRIMANLRISQIHETAEWVIEREEIVTLPGPPGSHICEMDEIRWVEVARIDGQPEEARMISASR